MPRRLTQADIVRKARYFQDHGEEAPDCIPEPEPEPRPPAHHEPIREPAGFRRSDSPEPIATDRDITDALQFESPDGDEVFALPRYAWVLDQVGDVQEPRIVIVDRDGSPTLSMTFAKTLGPASDSGVDEMPHTVSATLKINVPDLSRVPSGMIREFPLSVSSSDDGGGILTADLALTAIGLRALLVSSFGSAAGGAMVVVQRSISVAVPTGERFSDGKEAYIDRDYELPCTVPPTPLVLSDRQRQRLGGGGGVDPLRRVHIRFGKRTHTYWQDPIEPEHFYFLPDNFLLARLPDPPHSPVMRIVVSAGDGPDPLITMEFTAKPVIDEKRLTAARPELSAEAERFGSTRPVKLDLFRDAQPLLRLALPRDGAATPALTARADTEIDLELGLFHAETFTLDDFRVVYNALQGVSLTLLRGEIRVGASGSQPEDIPLELRLDRTAGDVLLLETDAITQPATEARLTNPIESPVVIRNLRAAATGPRATAPLSITGLPADSRLAPGTSCGLLLTFAMPVSDPDLALVLDQSGVLVEPDCTVIWNLVFDRISEARLKRDIQVHAVPQMFFDANRPHDEVLEFIVTIEKGKGVILNPTKLDDVAKVRTPIVPLLTDDVPPPFRYRTQTNWKSGATSFSEWREASGDVITPIRTAPPEN